MSARPGGPLRFPLTSRAAGSDRGNKALDVDDFRRAAGGSR